MKHWLNLPPSHTYTLGHRGQSVIHVQKACLPGILVKNVNTRGVECAQSKHAQEDAC